MNPQTPDDSTLYSRVEAYRATLTPYDQIRLGNFTTDLREALARSFGSRLSTLAVNLVVDRFMIDDVTITATKTPFSQLPEAGSRAGWDALAKKLVEKDEWCRANLVSSDKKLKAELAQQFKATLAPARLMTLARTGQFEAELDKFVKAGVAAHIEAGQ